MYASAYAAKVFYDLENTLLRNGEKYIQQKISSTWKMEGHGQNLALFQQIQRFSAPHRYLMGEYPVHLPALSGQIRVHIVLQGNVGIGVS